MEKVRLLVEPGFIASVYDEWGLVVQAKSQCREEAIAKAMNRAKRVLGAKLEFTINEIGADDGP